MPKWKWHKQLKQEETLEKKKIEEKARLTDTIEQEIEKDKKKEARIGDIVFLVIGLIIVLTLLYWFVYCPIWGCRSPKNLKPLEWEEEVDPNLPPFWRY